MTTSPSTSKNTLIIFLLIIVMMGPLIFAYVLVQKNNAYQFKLNHHGDLIRPVIPIPHQQLGDQTLLGKWWLIYVGSSDCTLPPPQLFHQMNQIQTALGKNASRLGKLSICYDKCQVQPDPLKTKITTVQLYPNEYEKLFKYQSGFYIADPKGNILMYYRNDTPPKGILSDLKRLLKISKIG